MGRKARVLIDPPADSSPTRLWTIDDVCHYLQFGRTKIFAFIKHPHHPLPTIRIGPSLRFQKADVDRWIERWKKSMV